MLRLILLTIVGLFGILAIYGTPEMAGGGTVSAAVPQLAKATPAEPVIMAAAAATPSVTPAEELIRAAMSGPEPTEQLAGPRLRVSPEHAGREHAEISTAARDDGDGLLYVAANRVNMRDAPAADGAVVGALDRGAAVRPVAPAIGPWVEIEIGDARRGFVSARYLSRNRPG